VCMYVGTQEPALLYIILFISNWYIFLASFFINQSVTLLAYKPVVSQLLPTVVQCR